MSGRYAEQKYGEQPIVVATFLPGDAVTIQVLDLATDLLVPITGGQDVCSESAQLGGIFYWSTANFVAQPSDFNQLVFRMTNAAGLQRPGKIVIGGFPSDSASRRFGGFVHIDTVSGADSTVFPVGTEGTPCKTITNAEAIALEENLVKYKLRGQITLTNPHTDFSIEGFNPQTDIATLAGSVDGSRFERVGIIGAQVGSIVAEQCLIGVVGGLYTGLAGTFTQCGFDGRIQPRPQLGGYKVQGLNLASQSTKHPAQNSTCILDYNGQSCVVIGEMKGIWDIENMPAGSDAVLAFALNGAHVSLKSTCAGGIYIFLGNGELEDDHTGHLAFLDNLIRGSDLIRLSDLNGGSIVIDKTQDPWQVVHYQDEASGALEVQRYDLYDGDSQPINNGNPLTDFVGARLRA
jgi:hypothetical protein